VLVVQRLTNPGPNGAGAAIPAANRASAADKSAAHGFTMMIV